MIGTTWLPLRAGLGISNFSEFLDAFQRLVAEPFSPLSLRYAPGTLGESERTLPWVVIGLVFWRLFGGSNVGDRSVKLREAASTIFALTAILPLLVFVYFMWRFGLLESTEAQIGIFFALAIALLGYVLFRRLTQRVADLGRALGQALPSAPAAKLAAPAPASKGTTTGSARS